MLDKRLRCVASMVRQDARLADVGTDHAYLPVALMQEGRLASAIAADIGEGPAASARQHIREAGLDDRIAVRVCDGLTGISPEEVTDVVIAGMGGETIIHILEDAPWTASAAIRLILQPMTKSVELRRWLDTHGFTIETEQVVTDGRRVYCVMAVRFCNKAPSEDSVFYYVGALPQTAQSRPYVEQQLTHLNGRLGGLRHADRPQEIAELEVLMARLQAFLNGGESE